MPCGSATADEELLFQNFVYGSLYGIHFTQQDGQGPKNAVIHGHGTDGSKVGVFFEQGDGRIDMINSELVAMSSENKIAIKLGTDYSGIARSDQHHGLGRSQHPGTRGERQPRLAGPACPASRQRPASPTG